MKREIVDALIASLNDPDAGWEYDDYRAWNDRIKCALWLANGPDQLEVKFWGDKIGGVETYDRCVLGGFFMPWRWRLWLAATRKQQDAIGMSPIATSTIVAAIRSASEASA